MKVIPLSEAAVAFEIEGTDDPAVASIAQRLAGYGLDEDAVRNFLKYRTTMIGLPPRSNLG